MWYFIQILSIQCDNIHGVPLKISNLFTSGITEAGVVFTGVRFVCNIEKLKCTTFEY